jgi:hypothetical protein
MATSRCGGSDCVEHNVILAGPHLAWLGHIVLNVDCHGDGGHDQIDFFCDDTEYGNRRKKKNSLCTAAIVVARVGKSLKFAYRR